MHSPPTSTITTTTRKRYNSKGSTAARKTISLTHVARRTDNPYDVKRTVEKLRAQQQQQQNNKTNTSSDVATSENSLLDSLSPVSVPSSPTTSTPIGPAAKVKILTNLLNDGSLGYSIAVNYDDPELTGIKKMNIKAGKSDAQRNNISDTVPNQNHMNMNMVSLLDPRPMARVYNAERSSAAFARQQQMTDTSESQQAFQSLFNYDEYRSANGRDTSRSDASRTKPNATPVAPPPPVPPPPPTYNGDEQSLHKLLTGMPTATSHRHEMATRSRRLSCAERSSAMSLRAGVPHWRSAINNIIGVSETVPTTSSHSFQPYQPSSQQMHNQAATQQMHNQPAPQQMNNQSAPQQMNNQSAPQQMQNQSANNLTNMTNVTNMPSRPIPQQAGNVNQTSEDLPPRSARISPSTTAIQQPPPLQSIARESAFVPTIRTNTQPGRIRARRMTIAEPQPIRNTTNIDRVERAPIQRIPTSSENTQYDIPPPNYTAEVDRFDESRSAPIYQTFVECRHVNHDEMPPINHRRPMSSPYIIPNRRQYSLRSDQHADWRVYPPPPVYNYNNGGGGGLQHPMWMNNNTTGPYQPQFRYNEPPPVYEESIPYGAETQRNYYFPDPEINRHAQFIRHAPVFFYSYQHIARQQHASNAWSHRNHNPHYYGHEYH